METAEGGTIKRIKGEEMVVEEDRISALPDGLLLEILARLPCTKSSIRTGTLSKRWKYLWTWVSVLIFQREAYRCPFSDFVSFVDKALTQCRQSKLRKFVIDTLDQYDVTFKLQVTNWIRYAISCDVEELRLSLFCYDGPYNCAFTLIEEYFINSSFTNLILSHCIFNPKGAISWKSLRYLCIGSAKLDENLIENILIGSPVLETLVLDYCYGYKRLDITSKSVKKLILSGYVGPTEKDWDQYYDFDDIIVINAPHILSLVIEDNVELKKILLLDTSSLVEANMDFNIEGTSDDDITLEETEKEMYKDFIRSLYDLKELKIKGRPFKGAYKWELLKKYGLDTDLKLKTLDLSGSCNTCRSNVGLIYKEVQQLKEEHEKMENELVMLKAE